jgi:hypothetical protein
VTEIAPPRVNTGSPDAPGIVAPIYVMEVTAPMASDQENQDRVEFNMARSITAAAPLDLFISLGKNRIQKRPQYRLLYGFASSTAFSRHHSHQSSRTGSGTGAPFGACPDRRKLASNLTIKSHSSSAEAGPAEVCQWSRTMAYSVLHHLVTLG